MVVRIECAVESERARPLVIELAVACRTERSGKFSWTVDARCDAAAVHGLIMGSHALPAWACMAIIPSPGALTHDTCMHRRRRTVAGTAGKMSQLKASRAPVPACPFPALMLHS